MMRRRIMKDKTMCVVRFCPNKITTARRKYCDRHSCRINTCKKAGGLCDEHYCHPMVDGNMLYCNAPVRAKGLYCSKHACPTCKKTRFECTEHFCGRGDCLEKKIEGSVFCGAHTCPVCREAFPCKDHSCRHPRCGILVHEGGFDFCDYHCMADTLYSPVIDMAEYNRVLSDFYRVEERDYELECFSSFDDVKAAVNRRLFEETVDSVGKRLNARITLKDSRRNDLCCYNYCSYGYCSCDLMPRIHEIDRTTARSHRQEEVFLLCEKARTHSDTAPFYMGWTLPRLFVEDAADLWDGTEEQIEKMIRFESVY